MMGPAQAVATDATIELPPPSRRTVYLPQVSTDPVDDLVERVRGLAGRAVDALQVAAALESEGITDRAAKVEYGYTDVFALAEDVYKRLAPGRAPATRPRRSAPQWRIALRDISHGALYLMPGAVYPAVLTALDRRSLVLGLVLGGGLGWVWAGGVSWLAYQLLGRGHPGRAGQVLRWSTVAGLPAAALLGWCVPGQGYGLVGLAAGQMAYQMASTVLMFYRREVWLMITMAPGVTAGLGYLVVGGSARWLAIGLGLGGVVAALAVALRLTAVASAAEPPLRAALSGQLAWVFAYTALSATFLLHAQAPYAFGRLDIALTAVPLFVGMGLVEWRARRFTEQSRALLAGVRYPRQFVRGVWLLLAAGVATCVGAVGVLAVALLGALRHVGLLSPAAVAMTAAHTVLAGAYFLSFILAGQARYGWLCATLAVSTVVHGAGSLLVGPELDTTVFLVSAVLLLALSWVALVPVVGQVWRFR